MAKNKRQPYAVSEKAGHQTSAESWGTGQYIQLSTEDDGGRAQRVHDFHFTSEADARDTQVALSPVFLVSLVQVPTVLVKQRLEICVVRAACLHLPRSGASGIKRSISVRSMSTAHVTIHQTQC